MLTDKLTPNTRKYFLLSYSINKLLAKLEWLSWTVKHKFYLKLLTINHGIADHLSRRITSYQSRSQQKGIDQFGSERGGNGKDRRGTDWNVMEMN